MNKKYLEKKWLAVIFLAIVLIVAAILFFSKKDNLPGAAKIDFESSLNESSSADQAVNFESTVYKNESAQYEIQYPDWWVLNELNGSDIYIENDLQNIRITVIATESVLDNDNSGVLFSGIMEEILRRDAAYEIEEFIPLSLEALSGYRTSGFYRSDNKISHFFEYGFITQSKKQYQIRAEIDKNADVRYQKIAKQVLDSFTIK